MGGFLKGGFACTVELTGEFPLCCPFFAGQFHLFQGVRSAPVPSAPFAMTVKDRNEYGHGNKPGCQEQGKVDRGCDDGPCQGCAG